MFLSLHSKFNLHHLAKVLSALLLTWSQLSATTFYVSMQGSNGAGTSWSTAKTSLSAAIYASAAGDEILVKYGTYNITTTLFLTSNRKITSDSGSAGSFATAQPDSSQCILQGDGNNRIFNIRGTGISNTTILRGLKITAGNASTESVWYHWGGGIIVYGGADPIIEHCWIDNNRATTTSAPSFASIGGGIMIREVGTNPIIRYNRISNNIATTQNNSGLGGGLGIMVDANPTIQGNLIINNIASSSAGNPYYGSQGGGMWQNGGSLLLEANHFEGNTAISRTTSYSSADWGTTGSGGAVSVEYCVAVIRNNIIRGNQAFACPNPNTYQGQGSSAGAGGIVVSGSSRVENNLFIGNKSRSSTAYSISSVGVGALSLGEGGRATGNIFYDTDDYSSSAVWANATLAYNCFFGNNLNYDATFTTSSYEVLSDPQFISSASGDYHLDENSGCIDTGDPALTPADFPLDYAGMPRVKGGRIDIGIHEYQSNAPPMITSAASVTAAEDQPFLYLIEAEDPDGNAVLWSVDQLPEWLTADSDSVFGVPVYDTPNSSFRIIASDGDLEDTLMVEVSIQQVNDPPHISAIENQSILMNESTANLSFEISDEETAGDDLIVTVTSSNETLLPLSGILMTGSGNQRSIQLTPAPERYGVVSVGLHVSDAELSGSVSFELEVLLPALPPVFFGEPITITREDEPYIFPFAVRDPNGDAVTVVPDVIQSWLFLSTSDPTIQTLTGNGVPGYSGDGGPAEDARISDASDMTWLSDGSLVFIDRWNYRIRKISPDGIISTIAGTGTNFSFGDNGPAELAYISVCEGICSDLEDNIYIAEKLSGRIRKISTDGIITTVAGNGVQSTTGDGGPATAASLNQPYDVDVDADGNIYILENTSSCIRKVDVNGIISTVAGQAGNPGFGGDGGPAIDARFYFPRSLALDTDGNIFVSDTYNQRIRKVSPSGVISTVVGGGSSGVSSDPIHARDAALYNPEGIGFDSENNLIICDTGNNMLRRLSPNDTLYTIAGDGTATFSGDGADPVDSQLNQPIAVSINQDGRIAISDYLNRRIRIIDPQHYTLEGLPGNDAIGIFPISIFATDGVLSASLDFNLEVVNVNDRPWITSSASAQAVEDQDFVYHASAEDIDDTLLVWQFEGLPDWLSAGADSVFGTPRQGDSSCEFMAIVSDAQLSDTLIVSVSVTAVNDPPEIISLPLASAIEDIYFVYYAQAQDVDGDTLSISFVGLPSWLTAQADSIFGTPGEGVNDTVFTILATDGQDFDTLEVAIQVIPVNDAPQLVQALGSVHIIEDSQAAAILTHLNSYFFDPDLGDSLQFAVSPLSMGLDSFRVNLDMDLIVWSQQDFTGMIPILISASDRADLSVSDTLHLEIQPANDAPLISNLPDTSFFEDGELTIPLAAWYDRVSDIESPDSVLSFAFGGNTHILLNMSGDTLRLASLLDWYGADTLWVTVSDPEGLSDTAQVIVNIWPVNDAPQSFGLVQPLNEVVISESDSVALDFEWSPAMDVDTDASTLTYTLHFMHANWDSTFSDLEGTITRINIEAFPREVQLQWTCRVDDGEFSTAAMDTFTLSIASTVGVGDPMQLPDAYALDQNYPNPFNPGTTLRYALPEQTAIQLQIYDLRGRLIWAWDDHAAPAGWHELYWDGSNQYGESVSAGVYLLRMRTPAFTQVKKMLLLK